MIRAAAGTRYRLRQLHKVSAELHLWKAAGTEDSSRRGVTAAVSSQRGSRKTKKKYKFNVRTDLKSCFQAQREPACSGALRRFGGRGCLHFDVFLELL